MKMPSTANQIELVLPLKERIKYLDRCLHHYRAYRVVVVDSSIKNNAALLSKFSNVEYFHTPNLDFYQQCSFGLEKINSPYTSILCDDDFLLHSFIKHAVTELQNNIEFSGAIGDSIRFFEGTFDLDVNRTVVHFRNLNYIRNVTRRSLVNGYGFFVRHYFAGSHAVFRTALLKQIIDDFECYPELKELNAADRAFLLFVFKRAPLLITNRIAHLRSSGTSVHVQLGMLKGRHLAQLLKIDAAPLNDIGLDIFDQKKLIKNISNTDAERFGWNLSGNFFTKLGSLFKRVIGKCFIKGKIGRRSFNENIRKLVNFSEAEQILGTLKVNDLIE